jgi:hypothetical protein
MGGDVGVIPIDGAKFLGTDLDGEEEALPVAQGDLEVEAGLRVLDGEGSVFEEEIEGSGI